MPEYENSRAKVVRTRSNKLKLKTQFLSYLKPTSVMISRGDMQPCASHGENLLE